MVITVICVVATANLVIGVVGSVTAMVIFAERVALAPGSARPEPRRRAITRRALSAVPRDITSSYEALTGPSQAL